MKKYEYVNIVTGGFFKAGTEEHRGIIDDYAARGYRYVGYFPVKMDSYGRVIEMDLIFESEVD